MNIVLFYRAAFIRRKDEANPVFFVCVLTLYWSKTAVSKELTRRHMVDEIK